MGTIGTANESYSASNFEPGGRDLLTNAMTYSSSLESPPRKGPRTRPTYCFVGNDWQSSGGPGWPGGRSCSASFILSSWKRINVPERGNVPRLRDWAGGVMGAKVARCGSVGTGLQDCRCAPATGQPRGISPLGMTKTLASSGALGVIVFYHIQEGGRSVQVVGIIYRLLGVALQWLRPWLDYCPKGTRHSALVFHGADQNTPWPWGK